MWRVDELDSREASALDGAKQLAYDCSKSVAQSKHPLKGPELVLRIWEATACSIAKELESGKSIFLHGLGTFGYKDKVVVFAPWEEFFQAHNLDVSSFTAHLPFPPSPRKGELGTVAGQLDLLPRVKHSVAPVARLMEVTSDVVQTALYAMYSRMGQEMGSTNSAISFAPLGTFLCQNRRLGFVSCQKESVAISGLGFGATVPLRKLLSSLEKRKKPRRSPTGLGGACPASPAERRPSKGRRPRMHKALPTEEESFPELLNTFSRTQLAPYVGTEDPGSPSSRIASSFTSSARLTWKPCQKPSRSLCWQPDADLSYPLEARGGLDYSQHFDSVEAESPLDMEIQEAEISRQEFFEVLYRYNYYFDTIPTVYLAPFSRRWTMNIGQKVQRDWEHLGESSELMAQIWAEVLLDYRQALRKVILEHVLNEERARRRTGVFFVPSPTPFWGSRPYLGIEGTAGGLPPGWESIADRQQQMAHSVPCSTASLMLLDLWHRKYDSLLLVQLPAPGEPLVDLQSFCQAQRAQMKAVRQRLEGWLLEAAEILQSGPTLLSTQVRGIVDRSIAAFVQFFARFRPEEAEAFLSVGLQAKGPEIILTTSVEEIEVCLLEVFESFVVCLNGLSLDRPASPAASAAASESLWKVSLEEGYIQEARACLAGHLRRNLERLVEALQPFDRFKHLLLEDVRIKELSEDKMPQEEVMQELKSLRAKQDSVRAHCAEEIRLPMVAIYCSTINETLRSKAEEAIHILLEAILRHLLLRNEQLCKSFEMVVNQVVKKPTSEMELVDLELYLEEFRSSGLNRLLKEFESIRGWLSFLFHCEDELMLELLEERHFQAIYDSAIWVDSIQDRVFDGNLKREREALESKFKEQRNKFLEDLEGYNEQVDLLRECGNLRQTDECLERIQSLKSSFARAHVEAEKLNAKEKRFGWEVRSPFEQLKRGETALEPYFLLWTLAYNMDRGMRTWLKGPLFQLEPAKVELEVCSMREEAARLKQVFLAGGGQVYPDERNRARTASQDSEEEAEVLAPVTVAEELGEQAAVMQDTHLKLLHALCNSCLQRRHWEQISAIIGFPLEPDTSFTLSKAIEMEVGQFTEELGEVSEAASKEYAIEMSIEAMEEEWTIARFYLQSWKQSGSFVFTKDSLMQLQQLLEVQLKRCTELQDYEHLEPWKERLDRWQHWLQGFAETLQSLSQLQDLWVQLEPIFSGRDLYKQLPAEIQSFRKADKFWRQLLGAVQQQPLAKELPMQLEQLNESRAKLQQITQSLEQDEKN
ncbi:unnamed protein product [Effrenium voratum]|uniref:Dynein heavy chain linker domain-containing protein n=1 Tax=Effrenium voratum TaxID=2562239 RepID=A0AA36ITV4_9DINO|nr:unnamed protein product [Effrenium voratum]